MSLLSDVLERSKQTLSHSLAEATFKYPQKSGSPSISEGITAASVTRCSLVFFERRAPRRANKPSRSLPRETCRLDTSRSPIRREANCDVPPCSLAEQRKISVLPQFSTIVCASLP